MRKTTLWFAILLFGVLITPVLAFDLGISPPDINLTLNRGEVYHGEVFVFGSEKESVQVKAYTSDWTLTVAGNYQFLPTGTLKRSASPWISLNNKDFNLPPKRGQKVLYTIRVPESVSGSYWGTIMFGSNQYSQPAKDRFQVTAAGRLAYIIRININGSPSGIGSIERYKLVWNPGLQKVEAVIRVKNSGSAIFRFKGRLELKDTQGKKVTVIPFREGYVLPDNSREFKLAADETQKLVPGFYIGLIIADFGERSLKAVQTTIEVKK